jgi:hypothetical protein
LTKHVAMKKNSNQLIDELVSQCKEILTDATKLLDLPAEALNKRANKKSWNVLECIEHMNLYGDYYLEEIGKQIDNSTHSAEEIFKSGWLGNYAAESMLPKKTGYTNWPMKTFPKMDPIRKKLDISKIDKFITQMNNLITLLEKSRTVGLSKTWCTLTIKWLKFSLGDTLRFTIYHNYRHMLQIKRVLKVVE